MLEIRMLPARQGDALWIRWGIEDNPHQILMDMGTEEIGEQIRQALLQLPEDQRKFDLLVVSHVDRDHIGGVLTCLAEADPIPGLEFKDIWFNGYQHLSGGSVEQPAERTGGGLEPMGPAQGERLSSWLRKQVWNKEFKGGPVQRVPGNPPKTVELQDGLKLTILGPTPARLEEFIDTWVEEVQLALEKGTLTQVSPGLEPMGSKKPPDLVVKEDMAILADSKNPSDDSPANGSSIALLLEYQERKIVLSGDAFPGDLVEGLNAVSESNRIRLDAFKLPHHCSKNNVLIPLVEAVDCERWLISTDGTRFRHPDDVALARVITYSTVRTPILSFNVPSKFNGWWDNEDWRNMYDYKTEYGTKEQGFKLRFG